MKLVILEPLGIEKEDIFKIAKDILGDALEFTYYDTRTTDTETLIDRGWDADIIAVSSLPLNNEVIYGFRKLKMLVVAFTSVCQIAMDACSEKGVVVRKYAD